MAVASSCEQRVYIGGGSEACIQSCNALVELEVAWDLSCVQDSTAEHCM